MMSRRFRSSLTIVAILAAAAAGSCGIAEDDPGGGGPVCDAPGGGLGAFDKCDGVDNDCDGRVDEDHEVRSTTCGVGACAATGATACVNGSEEDSCAPGAPAAADATCDGVDDDCDGSVDEDYAPRSTACGVGPCATTGLTSCVNGSEEDSCTPGAAGDDDATCDGVDDDCDGSVDEDYAPRSTTCGVGMCAAAGLTSCVDGSEEDSCAVGANDESCDGVDDDCDGVVDEDYQARSTSCGAGATASTGTTSCVNGQEEDSCTPGVVVDTDSTCDGVDDDADGSTDEDYAARPTTCGVGICATVGVTSCVSGSEQDSCAPGAPDAADDSDCDGNDSDCDGVVDEDCLVVCDGSFTITDAASVAAIRGCIEITGGLSLDPNTSVRAIYLPNLATIGGGLQLHQTGVASLDLPSLQTIGDILYFHQNSDLRRVSLNALTDVASYVYFHQNLALPTVGLDSLTTVGTGYLYLSGNTAMTSFGLGSLTSIGDYLLIAGNSALPTQCGDDLFAQLTSIGGAFTHSGGTAGPCVGDLDPDNDLILDPIDNCPSIANAGQSDGDGDGLGDDCECAGVTCPAIDQCHGAGACQPVIGECTTPELADGTACDDVNDCTLTDTCLAGACVGADPQMANGVKCGPTSCPPKYCVPGAATCMSQSSTTRLVGNATITDTGSLGALASYTEITGSVYMDASSVSGVAELPNLECIGEYLYIANNNALTSFEAPNLVAIGDEVSGMGYLYVAPNAQLNRLDFSALADVVDYVHIANNPMLKTECGSNLEMQLLNAGFTGSFTNSGNAPGGEICGDGIDNTCNGLVDENCP